MRINNNNLKFKFLNALEVLESFRNTENNNLTRYFEFGVKDSIIPKKLITLEKTCSNLILYLNKSKKMIVQKIEPLINHIKFYIR